MREFSSQFLDNQPEIKCNCAGGGGGVLGSGLGAYNSTTNLVHVYACTGMFTFQGVRPKRLIHRSLSVQRRYIVSWYAITACISCTVSVGCVDCQGHGALGQDRQCCQICPATTVASSDPSGT